MQSHSSRGSDPRSYFKRNASFRSSSHKKQDGTAEFVLQCQNVQMKLQAQMKCLEDRMEIQSCLVFEIQEFFKKRAEIELDYSQKLEKLAKHYLAKQKQEKQRRESWAIFSTHKCWQHLIGITKQQSKDHSVLSEIFNTAMCNRLTEVLDDLRRIFGKCKDAAISCHSEILKVLTELQSEMKQYQVFHGQAKQAEDKLKRVEELRLKVEQQATKGSRKLKTLEKQREKKQEKYSDCKLKALKARNEYLMSIGVANAATHKYFVDDLSLIIDCMDFGYHNALQRSMLLYNSCLENLKSSHQSSVDCIIKCVQELDPNKDKQNFLKSNSGIFSLPKNFEFQPHRGDEIVQVSAQKQVQDDLLIRYQQLDNRLNTLKLDNEETWKTVEAVDKRLIELINVKDYDATNAFKTDQPFSRPATVIEGRKRRIDSEKYYFEKFTHYVVDGNLLSRLQAKHNLIKHALGDEVSSGAGSFSFRPPSLPPKNSRPRRVGKTPIVGRPVVFGCNIEEYVEATGEAIPMVVKSCVRAINLYGMHHEGLFRVSGLQAEINEIKIAFEKGEDPLADVTDSASINSIAGVLKLFFRELQEPLFPVTLFDALVEASRIGKDEDGALRVRELIHTLSPTRVILMRYLFSFLNHVSTYSDENLMYPYNLAICFGPTLIPIPNDKEQVLYQNSVNDLIKLVIMQCETIFPKEEPGPVYEKILIDPGDRDEADGSENEHGDDDDEDDDAQVFEATASYDFEGNSERELSFKKGDTILLYHKVSDDWWEGACKGKEGYIPDKYVHIKRDDVSTPSTPTGSLQANSMSASVFQDPGSPTKARPEMSKRRSLDSQISPHLPVAGKPDSDSQTIKEDVLLETPKVVDTHISQESLSDQLEGGECSVPAPPKKPTPLARIGRKKEITEFGANVTTYLEDGNKKLDNTVHESMSDSTEKMNDDIDQALAEMMSNLETLTSKSIHAEKIDDSPQSPPPIRCTPDLVQDLPLVTNDTSPVGSYIEPPPEGRVESFISSDTGSLSLESAAETFANSDGTIIRIKSPETRPAPTSIKFIGTSFATKKELSSFKRSFSTSSSPSQKEDSDKDQKDLQMKMFKAPIVTGKAIHVRTPSIPSSLNLEPRSPVSASKLSEAEIRSTIPSLDLESRRTVSVTKQPDVEIRSMPNTPYAEQPHTSALFKDVICDLSKREPVEFSLSVSAEDKNGASSESRELNEATLPTQHVQSFDKKFEKPPPPVKAKPKPPLLPPKPKK